MTETNWFVYIMECADQTLYTGITTDIQRRLQEHNDGGVKGAKYTRNRRPINLMYKESCLDRSTASKREYAIKQLNRKQKLKLIETCIV